MRLRTTQKYHYRNGQPRRFWGCSRWPDCDCVHGAHPDGKPLGIPADDATKQARIKAHAAFDRLWKPELGGQLRRKEAYRVMRELMGMTNDEAHIGRFDTPQCETLIEKVNDYVATVMFGGEK